MIPWKWYFNGIMKRDWHSRIIAPIGLLHASLGILHRNLWLRPTLADRTGLLPMVVIGGLRTGGSGKTAVTLELVRQLSTAGHRIGILAYWLQKPRKPGERGIHLLTEDVAEVTSDADWTCCSDEAVLLARESGVRVFITRNREHAWDFLSRSGGLDVLISDDGLMDPRLQGAFRMILRRPGETPGVFDLFPAGPYRLTSQILDKVDCIVEGPLSGTQPTAAQPQRFWFRRTLIFPAQFDRSTPRWAICGLGNPQAFHRDLVSAGVQLAGMTCGPDHGLPNLERTRRNAARAKAEGFVCTAKDAIKLEGKFPNPGSLAVVDESIELSPGLISAVRKHIEIPASS